MTMSFAVKDGVPSMRFETHDRASMLFRAVDIELAAYPVLAWRWYIEVPIRSPLDERTRVGDDHPARLFLRLLTHQGEKRAMNMKKPSSVDFPRSDEDDVRSDRHKRPRRRRVRGRPLDQRSRGIDPRRQGQYGPTPRVGSRRRCENWDCRAG
jgi:hypothetical protein